MLFLLFTIMDTISGFLAALPFLLLIQFRIHMYNKKLDNRSTLWHQTGTYLFIFVLAGMLTVTGIPSIHTIHFEINTNFIPFINFTTDYVQYALNVILFIPLGLLLPLLWEKFASLNKVVLSGFLFSLAIELSQLFNFRATDIDDLLMNTLGATIGYYLFYILSKVTPKVVQQCQLKVPHMARLNGFLKYEGEAYIAIAWMATFFIQPTISEFLFRLVI